MKIEEKLLRYKQAFTLAVQIQDVQRQVMALQKMGDAYRQMRDYQKANDVLSQALGLTRDHHLKYQQANVLTTMGFNALEAHMISPAIYYSRVALHISKNIGSPLIQEAAWGNLGIAYRILGDWDIAKDCHKKSIDLCNTALRQNPDEHYKLDRAKEKANLAHIYLIKQELDKALQELEESLHTFEILDTSKMIVQNLISLGQVLIEKGDYEKANSHLTRGLRLARQQGDLLSQTDIQCFLAEISFQLNKDEEAKNQLLRAKQLQYRRLSLNAQRNTLTTKNSQVLKIPTNVEQVSLSARATIIESNLKVRQGKNAQAKAVLMKPIRVAEQYRLSGLESMHQISLVTSEIDVYNELIKLLIQGGEFIEAFNHIEQVKSRTLLDELRVAKPILPKNLSDLEQKRAEELLTTIKQSVELSYTGNIVTAEDLLLPIPVELTPDNSNLHYQAFLARKELNELLEPYIHTDNEYALLHGRALNYQQIQSILPENVAVVEFFVLEDTIHIFIISQKWKKPKYRVVSMPEKRRFEKRYWRHYEDEILHRAKSIRTGMIEDSFKYEWLKLGDELLAPIVPFLEDIEIVYFVPHGRILHQLPLHALTINDVPFIERWAVAYAPSASILTYILKHEKTVPNDKALVMSYTSETQEKAGFTDDAREIAKLFKQTTIKLDQEATSDVLRLEAPTSKFIHLLCHGTFDEENALNSGVFLGDMPAIEKQGTRFSAQDWLQLRLKVVSLNN